MMTSLASTVPSCCLWKIATLRMYLASMYGSTPFGEILALASRKLVTSDAVC